jgi:glucose dehydrogenase
MDDQQLMALDAASGSELWRAPVPSGMSGSPTVVAGVVVVATNDNAIRAFDAATGAPRWQQPIPAYPIASAYGHLYVGAKDGSVEALDAATGDELWRTDLSDPNARYNSAYTPAISHGVVFVAVDSQLSPTPASPLSTPPRAPNAGSPTTTASWEPHRSSPTAWPTWRPPTGSGPTTPPPATSSPTSLTYPPR